MSRLYVRSAELTGIALVLIAFLPVLIVIPAATLAQERRQPVALVNWSCGNRAISFAGTHEKSPGAKGNKYGFEGGDVVKLQGPTTSSRRR